MAGVTAMATSQARLGPMYIVKHLKECSEEAEEEHNHVKKTERHEARSKRDKLCTVMIKSVCWVV